MLLIATENPIIRLEYQTSAPTTSNDSVDDHPLDMDFVSD